jgi:hypothetical protein
MKERIREKDEHDDLVAQLREQGVCFLASSQVDFPAAPLVPPNQLIIRLKSDEPVVRPIENGG